MVLRQWIQTATVAFDAVTRALLVRQAEVETCKDADLTGPQTDTAVWTPAAGNQVCLSSLIFTVDADCTVTLFRGQDLPGKRLIHQKFTAGSGIAIPYLPMFRCQLDEALKVTTDAGNIRITLTGTEEPA